MKRQVFFSFHYKRDYWRVGQIKNMGVIEGQKICNHNEWEEVKNRGDHAIRKWIDDNMKNRSCVIVLIGQETANRKWINYEITTAWNSGKALMGIYIHDLKDTCGNTDSKGKNPFDFIRLKNNEALSKYVPIFEPDKNEAYNDIKSNLEKWIEYAIKHKQN